MLISLEQLKKGVAKKPLKLTGSLEKEYHSLINKLNQREKRGQKQSSAMINREGGDATLVNSPLLSTIHLSNYLAVARVVEALAKKKSNLANLRILGVGEGSGVFAFYLASILKPKVYLATDYQKELVNYGQAILSQGPLKFSFLDATKMTSIEDSSFDVIVACEFIEHIPTQGLVAFLKESKRVLKKGGVVIATTPNKGFHPGKVHSGYPHHLTEFTAKELEALLENRLAQVFDQEAIFYLLNRKICQERRRRLLFELVINRVYGLFLKLLPLEKIFTRLSEIMGKEIKRKKLTFPPEYSQTRLAYHSVNDKDAFGLCLVLQA